MTKRADQKEARPHVGGLESLHELVAVVGTAILEIERKNVDGD